MSKMKEFTNAMTGSRFIINVELFILQEPPHIKTEFQPPMGASKEEILRARNMFKTAQNHPSVAPVFAPHVALPIRELYEEAKRIFEGK